MKSLDEALSLNVQGERIEMTLAKGTKYETNISYYHSDESYQNPNTRIAMALIEEINQLKEKVKALETK